MGRWPFPETTLLHAIRAGIALVVLTPLVITSNTAFPFILGKAVYSRSLIEIVFVLWALLAIARPAWRPARSWLLVLLAANLGVAVLSACLGVSLQRSLWSTYERMQGLVDLAHWFAFTLVLVAVARTARDRRLLLNVNLAAGLALALIAVAISHGVTLPLFGNIPERNFPRIGATLGNATFLGAYMAVNLMTALGLLARSFSAAPPAPPAPWTGRLFWGAAALLHLWAFSLSASFGALAGLAAGTGFLGVIYTLRGRAHGARLAAIAAVGLLAGAAAVPAVLIVAPPANPSGPSFSNPLLQRMVRPGAVESTLALRLASWQAGLKGFAERPVLGWGPENYIAPFGRHAEGLGATMNVHDHAHNKVIEEAATKGALGLLAYLALWAFAFRTIVVAAAASAPRERTLALFVGGALAAYFAHSQSLFITASSAVQFAVLMAFAAGLETAAPAGNGPRLPPRLAAALAAPLRRGWGRTVAVAAVLALGGAGLAANRAIYSAGAELYQAETSGQFMAHLENAATGFEPLANFPRTVLFNNLAVNWEVLRRNQSAEALRLLAWADVEAGAAVAAEPANWQIHHALARMYRAAASTEPGYAGLARRHLERSLELAPNRDVFAPPRPRPAPAR